MFTVRRTFRNGHTAFLAWAEAQLYQVFGWAYRASRGLAKAKGLPAGSRSERCSQPQNLRGVDCQETRLERHLCLHPKLTKAADGRDRTVDKQFRWYAKSPGVQELCVCRTAKQVCTHAVIDLIAAADEDVGLGSWFRKCETID
jgi:hypothetical protein